MSNSLSGSALFRDNVRTGKVPPCMEFMYFLWLSVVNVYLKVGFVCLNLFSLKMFR